MTQRQKKYVKAIAQGIPKNQALQKAGYSGNTNVYAVEKSPEIRKPLLRAMEKIGITDDKLAECMREGLSAKKKLFFTQNGSVSDERTVKDMETRHKYLKTSLEVRGDLITNPEMNLNLGIIELPEREKD